MTTAATASVEVPARPSMHFVFILAAVSLLLLAAALNLAQLIFGSPFDLSGDEAHYWEWSRRLDWSYYSKGPLVAWIIALGRWWLADLSMSLVGSEVLAVRGPAIVLSIGTGLGLYTLAQLATRSAAIAFTTVALTWTIPIFAVGAALMTIDAPLACCYVWALVVCLHALRSARLWPWLVAGVLIALGLLAKYNMLLIFPAVGLAILVVPQWRRFAHNPGPYLAFCVGCLGLIPIILWNAQHDWVSFRHVAGQAGFASAPRIDLLGPLVWLGGQLAVIGPIWFVAMLAALRRYGWPTVAGGGGRTHGPDRAATMFLGFATLVPWGVFLAFSFITKIQPNWPMMGTLPGTILLATWICHGLQAPGAEGRRVRLVAAGGAAIGLASILGLHNSHLLVPYMARFAPPPSVFDLTPLARFDPAARLRGWQVLGEAVGRVRVREQAAGRAPFLVTDNYQLASQIAFYTPGTPTVYCLQAVLNDRPSQYDFWPGPLRNPELFIGRPCIYIGSRKPELFGEPPFTAPVFRNPKHVDTVEYRIGGHPIRIWAVYTVESFNGIPPELLARYGSRY